MLSSIFIGGVLAGVAAQPEIWVRARVELPHAAVGIGAADDRRAGLAWSVTAGVQLTPEAGGAARGGAAAPGGRSSPWMPSAGRGVREVIT